MLPKQTHRKTKPTPVQKVTLQTAKQCYFCHRTDALEEHHIFFGNGQREKSDRYGLVVWLCYDHHRGNLPGRRGVHFSKPLDDELKRVAQAAFEGAHGYEVFMAEIGRNYL